MSLLVQLTPQCMVNVDEIAAMEEVTVSTNFYGTRITLKSGTSVMAHANVKDVVGAISNTILAQQQAAAKL